MKTLTMYYDPSHAWLAVDLNDVIHLGLPKQISNSSYYQINRKTTYNKRGKQVVEEKTTVYLEEDCDAPLFFQACKEKGIEYQIDECRLGDNCFIRQLPRWEMENL